MGSALKGLILPALCEGPWCVHQDVYTSVRAEPHHPWEDKSQALSSAPWRVLHRHGDSTLCSFTGHIIFMNLLVWMHSFWNQPWIFTGRTDAEAKTPILWPPDMKSQLSGKDHDAWKDWGAGGEGGNRGWDGWMASLTQWTWVWASSRRKWRTGGPGVLQSTGWLSSWTATGLLKSL